jgi:hypothetical protein
LFGYCLIERIHTLAIDVILDVRRPSTSHLLESRDAQIALNVTYERIPTAWQESRSLPSNLSCLLDGLLAAWPANLPARVLLLHSTEHRWWMDLVAERCQVGAEPLEMKRISVDAGTRGEFCVPARCSLRFWYSSLQEVSQLPAAAGMTQLP